MNKLIVLLLIGVICFCVQASDQLKKINIADLEKMLSQKDQAVYLFDANVESTRKNVGIIPGARLVDSSQKYDLKKDLPPDLNSILVFYCANTRCSASHLTAEKAIGLGYKNVSVMVDGIYGWQKAGKKLEQIKSSSVTAEIAPKEILEMTPQEAQAAVLKKQAIIVDVRESEERHEVIDGALWFPNSKASNRSDWSKFVSGLPKDKKIIFHCAAGFRAKKLATNLAADGRDAAYFKGIDQWREAGLPLIRSAR